MNKILIICGSTSTGKTDLAILLAKKYNGELINADSRQVYQGMDIGTGKDLPISSQLIVSSSQLNDDKISIGYREKEGIPVWLVDICKPDYVFNVGEYQKLAKLVITDIQKRIKLPIIVGGTGLYIKSILEPLDQMQIPPNVKLRQQLDKLNVSDLQNKLKELNKQKFESMNHSDQNNPRRLIRAIEIAKYKMSFWSSDVIGTIESNKDAITSFQHDTINSPLSTGDNLLIGLKNSSKNLAIKIKLRVEKRLKQGILFEIQNLLNSGYSWDLPSFSGLGYKEWKEYFTSSKFEVQSSKNVKEIIKLWELHEMQYAKKQMTFFKKMENIKWYDVNNKNFQNQIFSQVNKWYNH